MQCSLKNFKIQSDVSEKRLEKIEEFLANNQVKLRISVYGLHDKNYAIVFKLGTIC